MRLAVLCSRIRTEEKLLLGELDRRGVPYDRLDDSDLVLRLDRQTFPYDLVFERSVSFGRSLYALQTLQSWGVRCINNAEVVATCGDKLLTSLALERAGVPTPRTALAFTPESGLAACEELGYPVVIKPVVGSWGRMVARANDRDAAEAILEDRATLGSWQQQIFYIQEYIYKPGRDIRAFVVGGETICAIYRTSEHWITNTARGGRASNCPVFGPVGEMALRAAEVVGGGILAIDLVETADGRLMAIEVNHTMEFRNSIDTTGINIPARMIDFVLSQAQGRVPARVGGVLEGAL
jgi:[lysine-biosynthesis-protein LysW]--L-2-aminoadipate ligase